MLNKRLFKVIFMNQGKIYELYVKEVSQGGLFGFIEIADFQFNEQSDLIVDPSKEKIKLEFSNVKRTYIPMHMVIRIDEVEKTGVSKIKKVEGEHSNITPFPIYSSPNNDT